MSEPIDAELEERSSYCNKPMGRPFTFILSPSPEYRSAMRDVETGVVTAICWDGTVDQWIQPDDVAASGE